MPDAYHLYSSVEYGIRCLYLVTPSPPFEDSHVLPCIVRNVRLLVDGNWSTCWQDDRTTDAIVTATTISLLLRFTASSQDNQR